MFISEFNYKQWADKRALDAALQINKELYGPETSFIRQQFNHMVIVEDNFKARLIGELEPHPLSNSETLPDLEELSIRLRQSDRWYLEYVRTLTKAEESEVIRFAFVDGNRGRMTRCEILFHILNHGTYHRGAIGRALDEAGRQRPADSYTLYTHLIEPDRRN